MAGLVGMVSAPVGLDGASIRLLVLLIALAFLLHAKPPQDEVAPFMRPKLLEKGVANETTSEEGRGLQAVNYASLFGINCGSTEDYTDSTGLTFIADRYYTSSKTTKWTIPPANTADVALFKDERFGMYFNYTIPGLVNGLWAVNLYEAEQWFQEPRQRVFHVTFNGFTSLYLQLFEDAKGKDKVFIASTHVPVTDNTLQIVFQGLRDNAKINAISGTFTRALNPSTPAATQAPATTAPVATQLPSATPTSTPVATALPTANPNATHASRIPSTTAPVATAATSNATTANATTATFEPTPNPTPVNSTPTLPSSATPTPTVPRPTTATPLPSTPQPMTPLPSTPQPGPQSTEAAAPAPANAGFEQEAATATGMVPAVAATLAGVPTSYYSALVFTVLAGPLAEIIGYRPVIGFGALGGAAAQIALLVANGPDSIKAAEAMGGLSSIADVILAAYVFLFFAERHFQLSTSLVQAAVVLAFLLVTGADHIFEPRLPAFLVKALPVGTAVAAVVVCFFLPKESRKSSTGPFPGAPELIRGLLGEDGFFQQLAATYKSKALQVLSVWWVFGIALTLSIHAYSPDLLRQNSADSHTFRTSLLVELAAVIGALLAIPISAFAARTGGLVYTLGSTLIGAAVLIAGLVAHPVVPGVALGIAVLVCYLLLCLVFAQSAVVVRNGRFALLFGTNTFGALVVHGLLQLALASMGWRVGHFFVLLGLLSLLLAVIFCALWAWHRQVTGRSPFLVINERASGYSLINGSNGHRRTSDAPQGRPDGADEHMWLKEDHDTEVQMSGVHHRAPASPSREQTEGDLVYN